MQVKYSTYDRKLLAAYLSSRHFRHIIEGHHTILRTDHKLFTYMFLHKTEKCIERQVRQISFLSQFIYDVEYVHGTDNVAPDVLSRFETAAIQVGLPDPRQWSQAQAKDAQLKRILSTPDKYSLHLRARDTPDGPIFTDFSIGTARTYVPAVYCRNVIDALHNIAHGGARATLGLIKTGYCWPDMKRQVNRWTKHCVQCQRTKTTQHTTSPVTPFAPAERRFGHIHIDLVEPLSTSNGFKYLLTYIDRFTR